MWPMPLAPLAVADRAVHLALALAFLDRLALVADVLALGHRDLDLGAPIGEVQPRRNDRQATLVGADQELVDLGALDQQLARALRLVIVARRRRVGRDV